jgi:ATP-dependent DNA helicase DinG
MLRDDEKSLIRKSVEALRNDLDGFTPRRAQLEMIATVAHAMGACHEAEDTNRQGRNIAVVEAGTGTGKTIGYLLPAIVLAKSRQKKLVIASATIALQHQLLEKDIPALQRLLPVSFTSSVVKGRGRFLCPAKLSDKTSRANQQRLDLNASGPDKESSPLDAQLEDGLTVELARRFESGQWNGDRDELKVDVPDALWAELVTDRQGCSGNKCPHFAQCPLYVSRQRAKAADVLIVNHSLLVSALQMDAAAILPLPKDTMFLIDEAHHLPAKTVEHFAVKHSIRGAQEWMKDLAETVRDIVLALSLDGSFHQDVADRCFALDGYLEDLYRAIDATGAFEQKRTRRFKRGVLPDGIKTIGEGISNSSSALRNTLLSLRDAMLDKAATEATLVQRLLADLGFFLGKLDNLVDTWVMLLDDRTEATATARWIEKYEGSASKNDYLVCAAPITAADRLRRLLWNRASAAVLTSATLTACGSFDLFLEQTGLSSYAETRLLRVDSPFDYPSKARLVIPALSSDPRDVSRHTSELVELLPQLINTQGSLVLFASCKQMRAVHAALSESWRGIILMQGSLPNMELIAQHKLAIDNGRQSVIFGLSSLSVGIDLPGEYCTHVIVAKLLFPTFDSPLEEAKREWIENQGRSSFTELSLPEAGVKLAQAAGRLLRTVDDYGTVTILDRRLISATWGAKLLAGLPPFALVVEKPHLKNAFRR